MTLARTAHPVECYAIRLDRRRAVAGLHRRHRPAASAWSSSPAAPTCCSPRRRTRPARTCPPGLHLTGREAGEHAAAAGVGRLLLTHIPSWVDEIGQLFAASAVFSETELVRAGATYEI